MPAHYRHPRESGDPSFYYEARLQGGAPTINLSFATVLHILPKFYTVNTYGKRGYLVLYLLVGK